MGNPLETEVEAKALAELNALSQEAKSWLQHHFNNGLGSIITISDILIRKSDRPELGKTVMDIAEHFVNDLDKATGRDRVAEKKAIEKLRKGEPHDPV